jgi:hypothetical protein
MNGGTVIEMRLEVAYESDYKLDIIISEEAGHYHMEEPMKIDLKRLVLLLLTLIVLIYAVRLTTPPLLKLNIHNQCLNIDLVSPTYITDDNLECYSIFNHKVCAGETMRSGFIIKYRAKHDGALMYRLQRRQMHDPIESSKDTSSAVHLLVAWCTGALHANVLLVKHERLD